MEAIQLKWAGAAACPPCVFSAVNVWHNCAKVSYQFMRGWGDNAGVELRQCKGTILGQILTLDVAYDSVSLTAEEWLQWYAHETSLMAIFKGEEIF